MAADIVVVGPLSLDVRLGGGQSFFGEEAATIGRDVERWSEWSLGPQAGGGGRVVGGGVSSPLLLDEITRLRPEMPVCFINSTRH